LSAVAAWLTFSDLSSTIFRGKKRNSHRGSSLTSIQKVFSAPVATWKSAKLAKEEGRTRDRTWITGIRIRCANHYTIQPIVEATFGFSIYDSFLTSSQYRNNACITHQVTRSIVSQQGWLSRRSQCLPYTRLVPNMSMFASWQSCDSIAEQARRSNGCMARFQKKAGGKSEMEIMKATTSYHFRSYLRPADKCPIGVPRRYKEEKTSRWRCIVAKTVSSDSWGYDPGHDQFWSAQLLRRTVCLPWKQNCGVNLLATSVVCRSRGAKPKDLSPILQKRHARQVEPCSWTKQ
jgi:hypothetical protein